MLGQSLPLEIRVNQATYLFDYREGAYQIRDLEDASSHWIKLSEKMPPQVTEHLSNWFTIDHLPAPDQCHYVQCAINSLFFPTHSVCLLVGYAEKYRKYFYPLQIDLDKASLYLTGQPIYYNFNQAVALDTGVEPPVLRIHSFSKANRDNNDIYQPRSKRDLDLYWEPPVNLIRIFTLNPSPTIYKTIA